MSEYHQRFVLSICCLIALFVSLADQVSKYVVLSYLQQPGTAMLQSYHELEKNDIHHAILNAKTVNIIPGFFDLALVGNKGAAFGIFTNVNHHIRTLIFTFVSLGALVLLIYIYRSRPQNCMVIPIAVGMVIGGAIGNWIDRIRFGQVIDFLDVYIKRYHWPTFNVADSSITVGVGLLLVHMIFFERK